MTITLHLQFLSWQFATIVTLCSIVITLLVANHELKLGDFGAPLLSFATFLVFATASLCCWAFVLAHYFFP